MFYINSKSDILTQLIYWIKINHKWRKKLLGIRIAKTSKFVVKHCITPELGNPKIDVELVSISTFGVVSVAASISDIVVVSNIVVGIVFV